MLVSHHDAGIADLDFGMSDAPVWASHPHSLCSPERRFVKFNRGGAVPDDEIGLQRVVGVGNGLCSGHRVLLNRPIVARREDSRTLRSSPGRNPYKTGTWFSRSVAAATY